MIRAPRHYAYKPSEPGPVFTNKVLTLTTSMFPANGAVEHIVGKGDLPMANSSDERKAFWIRTLLYTRRGRRFGKSACSTVLCAHNLWPYIMIRALVYNLGIHKLGSGQIMH